MDKVYDLTRFIIAHRHDYQKALGEIKNGRKTSHWMWYIFPQLKGLGRSATSEYYGLVDSEEAKAFLFDPYLGANLKEITYALLQLEGNNPTKIMGHPDDLKLKSSMTLFACVAPEEALFRQVLEKYYSGQQDRQTLRLLQLTE